VHGVFFYSGKCRPSRNEYLPGLIYIQGWDIRRGVRGRKHCAADILFPADMSMTQDRPQGLGYPSWPKRTSMAASRNAIFGRRKDHGYPFALGGGKHGQFKRDKAQIDANCHKPALKRPGAGDEGDPSGQVGQGQAQ
jgi:hypothetical protein